ncbi:hypothetical protein KQX54_002247 [Cotesia glomerata]|uniref:Uncharacterized protein n=3 Tax=Cotesia glomerata TaxID=32391 RepID=A0AAV7HY78_COTGL|nr:hypothetical protein KQX54_002247 [Cotesia glomerata]
MIKKTTEISSINSQIIMALTRTLFTSFFSLLILEILAAEDCDKSKCPGPIKYYEDIKCTPVYNSPEDCCPYKYNCDHLQARSPKKCYVNNHEYEIRDRLRSEDANPCSKSCFCSDRRAIATFTCAIVDCFTGPSKNSNCYRRRQASRCCPGEEVCPEKAEDIPTCEVDGKIYKDAEYFRPASEPHKICYCGPGYIGENVEPFCITPVDICRTELQYAHQIISNCSPVYYNPLDHYNPEVLHTECPIDYKCQDEKDTIIKKNSEVSDPDKTCKFGNLVLNYGDEIRQPTGSSVCMKCVCDVGPTVTCLYSPNMRC